MQYPLKTPFVFTHLVYFLVCNIQGTEDVTIHTVALDEEGLTVQVEE